jgi:hypothetical protein
VADKSKSWEIRDAQDVAEALDWLRRRMNGKGLVLVAIGANSVAFSKEQDIAPEDAVALIENEISTLRHGFHNLRSQRVTRGHLRRGE